MQPDFFMREALREAEAAYSAGEVPVGAVIEKDGEIIGRGENRIVREKDPTAHAELIAIRQAAKILGSTRLLGCRLYVTTEPCAMCAGAIVLARLEKIYIGALDPKTGACGSLRDIVRDPRLNHQAEVETGLLGEECGQLLRRFFQELRTRKKYEKEQLKSDTGGKKK